MSSSSIRLVIMIIRDFYIGLLSFSAKIFGSPFTKLWDARIRFGRKLNLSSPETLADKVSYLELFEKNPLKIRCTDKYAVRDYVFQKGLGHILVPLCHEVCDHEKQIDFDALPQQFVMKATHGCGMNLICEDKSELSETMVLQKARGWLSKDYFGSSIEPHYKDIPHRIIFEELLENAQDIIDYKFYCFHGSPDFILVCSDRVNGVKLNTYSIDWTPIHGALIKNENSHEMPKPTHLEQMLHICRCLSSDFDFVRVDLYEINGKIYFGELTFSPATGVFPDFNEHFLKMKGSLLTINK